ncbi:MAG: hypothetical protein QGG53_02710 [Planctomycetota bacterium]|jgi:hypothetical protein|nr:hypothetical protein [Planctomycetota bacterium]
MQLLFETQLAITDVCGRLNFFQTEADVLCDPVLTSTTDADRGRVTAKTVLHDSGIYRMWYQAFPNRTLSRDGNLVGYAESDDGLTWRKPELDLVENVSWPNNYCDLGLTSPSVFIDPKAEPSHRYRATGYRRGGEFANPQGTTGCFYTAHSPDGLHWELDSDRARWYSGDTIRSAYHPQQQRGICAMKFVRRMNGITRRSIWTADLRNGNWGDPVCALVPDEFDDVAAVTRGCNSCDYYSLGLLPAGSGTVALLDNFWHTLPLSMQPENYAIFGTSDITLAYQAQPGDRWLHVPGRKSFIPHGSQPWNAGWIWGTSCPVEVGDEHWFYVSGSRHDHAWHMDEQWKVDDALATHLDAAGDEWVVGVARWPKWRLFGFHANPRGHFDLELGELSEPSELLLNYRTEPQGCVQVQIFAREVRNDMGEIAGRSSADDAVPLTGDSLAEVVAWRDGTILQPVPGKRLVARIVLDRASVYAWETQPARD